MSTSRGRGPLIIGVVALVTVALVALIAALRPVDETAGPQVQQPDASAAFGPVGTTETVPCPDALEQGAAFQAAGNEVEGETYSCGVVVVPENHDKPDGRTIELFYLKLHSRADDPAGTPMVYLAGGPGGSASYELTANPLLNQRHHRLRPARHGLLQLPAVRALRVGHRDPAGP
ncbi:MAG: hypothetical protein MUD13_04545 [Candidatus Nanopelagicales bacterium]|nr:hypothetical protein [Candidatus Nanopelagicales bacterium]